MSTRHEGLLEKGYWESTKPDSQLPSHHRAARWCVNFLRPSFLDRTGGPRTQLRRTAYLDGLRGFAAFIVYWGHHHLWPRDGIQASTVFENAFGHDDKYYFATLPGVRTLFSGGHFAVTVFFVISGYVLSTKPLQLIQNGEHMKLGDNLASALFRRWIRLHIPVIVTTFLYLTSWHAFGIWTDSSEHQSNYRDEVWKWYCEFKNYSFVFRTGGESWLTYNFHLWSIPVEFRGSIVIYTALLAFSRCTRNARLCGEIGLIFYFLYIVDGWFCSMFMSGMLLCDLDLLAASDDIPRFFSRLEPWKKPIFYSLFAISIYLGGVPSHSIEVEVLRDSIGWHYLSYLKPQAVFDPKWFYLFWAATFLVSSIPRISWLKDFFELRFNQYLGRISFSFYLVHGPILWTLGDRLYSATGWVRSTHEVGIPNWINLFPLSKAGPYGLDIAWIAPHLILLPVTLWLAEIVTKLIDEPSVKFAQWLYSRTLAPAKM
jgi:peptidoglycan/LPS O-acetylase OafA/YrhL